MKSDSITKKLLQNKFERKNHHFVFIEAPLEDVAPEVMAWGQASWWPQRASMRFIPKSSDPLAVGSRFMQQTKGLIRVRWDVEVTKLIPNREIERTFLNGLFIGHETLTLEPRINGTRVDYIMVFKLRGFLNSLLWSTVYEKLHNKNIELIMASLKDHCLKKQKEKEFPRA